MENLKLILAKSCKKIAPAWPLKNSVAVNPFLGLADLNFNKASKVLKERSDIEITMPLDFYLTQINENRIIEEDLQKALKKSDKIKLSTKEFLENLKLLASSKVEPNNKLKSFINTAEDMTAKHWNELLIDRVSAWAASYFDESQTLWNTTDKKSTIYQSWKKEAEVDLTSELIGLKNFRKIIKQLPADELEATKVILEKLAVPEALLEAYLHALLLNIIGWSSYISGKDWNNAIYGGTDTNLQSFLTILLAWELCVFENFKVQDIDKVWKEKAALFTANIDKNEHLDTKSTLQNAYDIAIQRQLAEKFLKRQVTESDLVRPKAQAVFCIDVRSEVYRRNLEKADNQIETLGFAGFFGLSLNYVPLANHQGKNQCPVLIPSVATVKETFNDPEIVKKAIRKREVKHQVDKNWKLFKKGAVASFGFVSPLGLSYFFKLMGDSFGITKPVEDPNVDGLKKWMDHGRDMDVSDIPLADRIKMAEGALTAMGLKEKMAQMVLIVGHGATSINNPHATGLDCGACGGHSGEVNAMTAEKILNDKAVRTGLLEKGFIIPEDTHFVASLHNTTTDEITLIGEQNIPKSHQSLVLEVKHAIKTASASAREERSKRMNLGKNADVNTSIFNRSKDWSQIRPEWGLSGCNSFIIAPRNRTSGINLEGKSFLHSYDWKTDEGFNILEAIISAPMVVTSWINLQYYASTTDNEHLGAGNKTLHNVTGGFGVLEGSAGDLRIGLPLQSIHDGTNYQHLPQRLNVVIEAPIEAVNNILTKHSNVKELCDNEWITLLQLGENGTITSKYAGNCNWEQV